MSEAKGSFSQIKALVRKNKNFVFKGKKYPVDFRLIKSNSNFFFKKKNEYKQIEDIVLQINNADIIEDSILTFIACCQNEPFEITADNVFSLHQLSIQYEVPELNKLTNEYIIKNDKKIIFQSLFFKLKNQNNNEDNKFDTQKEEEEISSHFFEYINDINLLSLPIPILYRIVNKLNLKTMNQTNQSQYIEFLFKCLDSYKREASILFLNIDIANERADLLSRLLYNYNDVFDFNMLNNEFLLKTSSQLLSELKSLKIEYSKKFEEIQTEFQRQRQFMESFIQSDFDAIKRQNQTNFAEHEAKIDRLNEELTLFKSNYNNNNEMTESKLQSLRSKLDEFHNNFQTVGTDLQEHMRLIQNNSNEVETLNNQIESLKNQINQSDSVMQRYVTKDQLRQVMKAGQVSYLETSYPDYRDWHYSDEGNKIQLDGNHGCANVGWGWKKAFEAVPY